MAADPNQPYEAPSERPLLIYDGDCSFCERCVEWLQTRTSEAVEFAPYQDDPDPSVSRQDAEQRVHLVEPDGLVTTGMEAIVRALAMGPGGGWAWYAYTYVPGVARLGENLYDFVARHRKGISRLSRLTSGPHPGASTYNIARRMFLVMIGLLFAVAFVSFWVQAPGLFGSDGIMPLAQMYDWQSGLHGFRDWLAMPTVFWLSQGDWFLHAVCGLGTVCSLLMVAGIAPRWTLAAAWALYLSLMVRPNLSEGFLDNPFVGYQWDGLLLEAGFIAFWLTPGGLIPGPKRWRGTISGAGRFLAKLLLFRLVLLAGIANITGPIPTWASQAGLNLYLWTQPLPSWISHAAYESWIAAFAATLVVMAELTLPWLLFGPRRLRMLAGLGIGASQVVLYLLGNLGFYFPISMALCVLLIDDGAFRRFRLTRTDFASRVPPGSALQYIRGSLAVVLTVIALSVSIRFMWADTPSGLQLAFQRYPIINGYDLPSSLIAERRSEIVLEGSADGAEWKPYTFAYKPGGTFQPPPWLLLHLPRFDWELSQVARRQRDTGQVEWWFAHLFVKRLLEGGSAAAGLLGRDPFPDHPPKYVRIRNFDYEFARRTEVQSDRWWTRNPVPGLVMVLTLRDGQVVEAPL